MESQLLGLFKELKEQNFAIEFASLLTDLPMQR
jgi:hypothetical protein